MLQVSDSRTVVVKECSFSMFSDSSVSASPCSTFIDISANAMTLGRVFDVDVVDLKTIHRTHRQCYRLVTVEWLSLKNVVLQSSDSSVSASSLQ